MEFVNKNAIESDFWGDLCRSISKILEKSSILTKSISKNFEIFRSISTEVGSNPSSKIGLIVMISKFSYIRYKNGDITDLQQGYLGGG